MKSRKIAVLMLLFLLILPLILADDEYEEDRAEFAGLAEVGFVLIIVSMSINSVKI